MPDGHRRDEDRGLDGFTWRALALEGDPERQRPKPRERRHERSQVLEEPGELRKAGPIAENFHVDPHADQVHEVSLPTFPVGMPYIEGTLGSAEKGADRGFRAFRSSDEPMEVVSRSYREDGDRGKRWGIGTKPPS
jgi:hypothetical protein